LFIHTSSLSVSKTVSKGTSPTQLKPDQIGDRLDTSVSLLSQKEMDFHLLGHRFKQRRNHSSQAVEQAQQNQFGELSSTFPGRNGYDKNFLGTKLDLPKVDPSMQDKVATLIGKPGETELTYTNFSVVMQKERRQPLFTAVNIDGAQVVDVPRKGKWTIDARIPREQQLGDEAYGSNPIDRGHMVRRRDPVWGPNPNQASNDTFVFTNAGLQHGNLNQRTWLDLENYILDQAKEKDLKLTVMTGPVFSPDDPSFDNNGRMDRPTQIPQEFWKVVVWNDKEEGLKGAAFIQSQKDYVGRGLFKTDFDSGAMSLYQMPLDDLEKVTKLDFGDIGDTASATRALRDAKDAVLA
jgi:endonuclease G, mitochondrial